MDEEFRPTARRPKIEPVNRNQLLLRTVDIEQLVSEDDPVRAIWELVGRLDLSRFYEAVASEEGEAGREAIDPKLLICLWVYAYSQGMSSAREVSRVMEYHPGFQWLAGMRVINHHTLSDFRIRHREALDQLFTQILGVLSHERLLTLERVTQDGTKITANAGTDSFHRAESLQEHLRLAQGQVAAMGDPRTAPEIAPRLKAARQRVAEEKQVRLAKAIQELEEVQNLPHRKHKTEEARVSATDPECRIMKQGGGGAYAPSYNVQISTDAVAGAIVDVMVSKRPVDADQLPEAVDRIEARLGKKPGQMIADAEFTTNESILAMNERKVDFIGSLRHSPKSRPGAKGTFGQRGHDPAFWSDKFIHDPATDTLRCPAGKTLAFMSASQERFRRSARYRAQRADCLACPYRLKCTPYYPQRTVEKSFLVPVLTAFRARMATEAAKAIYRVRGRIAEFTNAWIKDKMKLRQFRLRGRLKTELEMMWACLTCNIQLWIRRIWRPGWTIMAT